MTLGEKIKHHRKLNNLSQENVGELVGVSRQAVTRWENNLSAPSTDNLIKLATIFKIPLQELVNDNAEVANNIPKQSRNKVIRIIAIVWGSIILLLTIALILTIKSIKWSSLIFTLINLMLLLACVVISIYIVVLLIRALNKYLHS